MLFSSTLFAQTSLFEIKSDKESYLPGEKAILVTHVQTYPQSPNFEVVFKSQMNSLDLEVVKVSGNNYISKIENVGNGPTITLRSQYYLRDKYQASDYERAILISEEKVSRYVKERRSASSSERIELNQKINTEEDRILFYKTRLESLLRLVEERNLIVSVAPAPYTLNSSFLFLNASHENQTYQVGEVLTLFGHVNLEVHDKDALLKAFMGSTHLSVEELSNNEFVMESLPLLPGQIGEQEVRVELYVRDEYRSRQLEDSIHSVNLKIVEINNLIAIETDSVKVLEYQKQIISLNSLKMHIQSILREIEQLIEVVKIKIKVESLK